MLFDVLSNRACVNVLKILHDNETSGKTSYSLKKSDVLQMIKNRDALDAAIITLGYEGLILREEAEGEMHLSITEKGKRFIAAFDQIVAVMKDEAPPQRQNVEIKYDLTDNERKVLITLYRLQFECGKEVSLSDLSRELYPYEESEKKKTKVSSVLTRLNELNLVEKTKNERVVYASITPSGEKIAKSSVSMRTA